MAPLQEADLPGGLYRQYALERVIHGVPFIEAVHGELEEGDARRAFLIGSSGFGGTRKHQDLRARLGSRLVGESLEMPAHSPFPSVLDIVRRVRELKADHLIALGGGSVIDAAKAVAFWSGMGLPLDHDRASLPPMSSVDPSRRDHDSAQWLRITAVPVTLSAAEHTYFAGITEPTERIKRIFGHPLMVPRAIVYDPSLTLAVDFTLFLASGIKALDHAVERLASLKTHPFSEATGLQAVRMLCGALPKLAASPDDLAQRQQCQLAAWLSIAGANAGVRVGASHAIGHVLGAHARVPHGLTSCVVLASVMRWNLAANRERQRAISAAMGKPDMEAGDAVEQLVGSLGLPTRLREVGVSQADFGEIAGKSLHDPAISQNPRRIAGSADVMEILRMAW